MTATQEIARIETRETITENTQYGPYEVKCLKVERVVQWPKGNLELRVDFWENGQKRPGYSDGNRARIDEVLSRA